MSGDWVSWVRVAESEPYFPVLLVLGMEVLWEWSMRAGRRGMFFGVRVEDGFAASAEGQGIARGFRTWSWVWTLALLAIYLGAFPWKSSTDPERMLHMAVLWVPSVWMLGNWAVYGMANRRVKRAAVRMAAPVTRMAALFVDDEAASWWMDVVDWLAIALPLGLPLVTAAIVGLMWHRYPVAYSAKDELENALFCLCAGVFPAGVYCMLRWRARSSDWAASPRTSRRYRMMLGLTFTAIFLQGTVQLCGMTLIPLLGGRPFQYLLPFLHYSLFASFGMLAFVIGNFIYLRRTMERGASDPMADACWKWGSTYYNPGDPAMVVPGRSGFGFSPNFANRVFWVFGGAYVVGIVVCLVSLMGKIGGF